MSINLIQQYYLTSDVVRQDEINICLSENLQNKYIDRIHLLTENEIDVSAFPRHEKIMQVVIGQRLTFNLAFKHANTDKHHNIWIVSNADIYFDESLQYLNDANLDKVVFALTRHDIQRDGKITNVHDDFAHGCQDAWIFKAPIDLNNMFTDFCLGVTGCDGRIAYELIKSGYKVINPSLKIIGYHLDLSREMDIFARNDAYAELMTEENYLLGKAAPPPYQYYIYPVDQIDPDSVEMYRSYIRNLTNLGVRPAQLSRQLNQQYVQIEKLGGHLEEQRQLMEEMQLKIVEQQKQIQALLQSWSWRVTKPLRKICSLFSAK